MRNVTFRLSGPHPHAEEVQEYLRLRKRFFVDRLGWDIPHTDSDEQDQYDNPTAWYSLAIDDDGHVAGGVRLMPTSSEWHGHTYMLRDAHKGRIKGIPPWVMEDEIVSPQVWEMTRLVLSEDLETSAERAECLEAIGEGLKKIAAETECQEFMGLTFPAMARALKKIGYLAESVTRPYRDPSDGRAYSILRIPVMQHAHSIAAE